MTPLEATARAREAVLAAVARGVRAEPDLVAVCEAAGGLCPRKGRALLRILARSRLLEVGDCGLRPGPRHPARANEESRPFRSEPGLHANARG